MSKYEIYSSLTDKDKRDLLEGLYVKEKLSDVEISEIIGTYSNKIRRDRVRLGIKTRSPKENQKLVLAKGRAEHPTKGKHRNEEEKRKIGEKVSAKYATITQEEKDRRAEISRKQWEDKTEKEKGDIIKTMTTAVRVSSRTGSSLEKFLLKGLIRAGYRAEFHKEHSLKNEKLEVDLLLPELNIAIEVDGPSHIRPVWGEERFEKTQKADKQKTGLLVGGGMILIRVRYNGKKLSEVRRKEYLTELLKTVEECKSVKGPREIIVGDK